MKYSVWIFVICFNTLFSQTNKLVNNEEKQFKYCIWPYSDTISENTNFLVETYNGNYTLKFSRTDLSKMFRLVCKKDTISFEILQVIDKDSLNQFLLKPLTKLKIEQEYEFYVTANFHNGLISRRNQLKSIDEQAETEWVKGKAKKYRVSKNKKLDAPEWKYYPHPLHSQEIHTSTIGDKPKNPIVSYITLDYELKTKVECLIKLICKEIRTGAVTEHFFASTTNNLSVGHNESMTVVGLYDFSAVYDLKFEILDIFGNTNKEPGFITVLSPTNKNYIIRRDCLEKNK